jgi:cysteinyl-tRNA synthetase
MTEVYQDYMRRLGCVEPSYEPKVSEHVAPICALIERLIAAGTAYVIDLPGGERDVYFSVRSFAGYGKLSRRRLEELLVGARVAEDERKRDPLDFALWKGAAAGEWGFPSPWGNGRPGWHIECSAMSLHYLGHGFDVHTGGMDLIFPHHENEIAQSEAACPEGGSFARMWLHNGFVNIDKEKMSKSLGNFVTLSDVLDRNDPEAFRWFLLGAHYRGPIQFETEKTADGRVVFPGVDEAERRVDHLYGALERVKELGASTAEPPKTLPAELSAYRKAVERAQADARAALEDDLNTPVALAALGELARLANELGDLAQKRRKDASFAAAAALVARELEAALSNTAEPLGVLAAPPSEYRARTRVRRLAVRGLTQAAIEGRIEARTQARANKDFAESDRIRQELLSLGVALRDTPAGTEWTVLP